MECRDRNFDQESGMECEGDARRTAYPRGRGNYILFGLHSFPLQICLCVEIRIKKSLNLQTNTPVVEVSQYPTCDSKKEWIVHTDRGNIRLPSSFGNECLHWCDFIRQLPRASFPLEHFRPGSRIVNNPALKRTISESPISGEHMQSRAGLLWSRRYHHW